MSKNIGQGRDKRTEQQRINDAAQNAAKGNKAPFVTTGPETGVSDARTKDVADADAVFEE